MSRRTASVATAVLLFSLSSAAHAVSYGRFCATWRAQFGDGDGGDNLTANGTAEGDLPAAYAQYRISYGTTTFDGWLSSAGCATITILPNTTYQFTVYTKARATGGANATIQVQPECTYGWVTRGTESMTDDFTTTASLLNGHTYPFDLNQPSMDWTTRVMPIFGQAVRKAGPLAELGLTGDAYTRVSFDTPSLCGGVHGAPYNCNDWSSSSGPNICVATGSTDSKFMIAHEYGHVVSQFLDGPAPGSADGDEGVYNAQYIDNSLPDGICDATVARPGGAHAFTSREFIGVASSEGWGHFIATVLMNDRPSTPATDGEFVYYMNVMNSTAGHPSAPPTCGGSYCAPPYYATVGDSAYIAWMDYECNPFGDGFVHYGTEWDWLRFYWGIWAGATYRYDVDEIAMLWSNAQIHYNNRAVLCCQSPANPWPPSGCTPSSFGAGCNYGKTAVLVGKLWTTDSVFSNTHQVLERAQANYSFNKYMRFVNAGDSAKVNY